ncbi:MAG TPA: c-type cytochrome [Chitinophagaceae bacterium]
MKVADKQKIIVTSLLLTAFLSYTGYLYAYLPVKEKDISADVFKGKLLWQQNNCNACHQVYGLGGYLGPDLTNVYSLRGPAYIRAFLQNGTSIMPDFKLNEHEIKSLTAYLQNIDASGTADPRKFSIQYDGTISQ